MPVLHSAGPEALPSRVAPDVEVSLLTALSRRKKNIYNGKIFIIPFFLFLLFIGGPRQTLLLSALVAKKTHYFHNLIYQI